MTKQKQDTSIYEKNPDIMAAFLTKNDKLIFDFDEKRISLPEIMIVLQNTVTEYLRVINKQSQQQVNHSQPV